MIPLRMVLTNELILLAPKVLNKKKPLEHKSFVGLFTSLSGECSEGFIYLIYSFTNVEDEKDIEGWLTCEPTYYNSKTIIINNAKYTIYRLKSKDILDLESCKNNGNLVFDLNDWINTFIFWEELGRKIKYISNTTIYSCLKKFDKEKGLVLSSPLFFQSSLRIYFL